LLPVPEKYDPTAISEDKEENSAESEKEDQPQINADERRSGKLNS